MKDLRHLVTLHFLYAGIIVTKASVVRFDPYNREDYPLMVLMHALLRDSVDAREVEEGVACWIISCGLTVLPFLMEQPSNVCYNS